MPSASASSLFTRFFVEHRLLGWLAMLGVLAWGWVSFQKLPQQEDPTFPTHDAVLLTVMPEDPAAEIEKQITVKLEEVLAKLPTLEKLQSQSKDNVSIIVVTLKTDRKEVIESHWKRARELIAEVKLPEGYYLVWGGQFENMERATKRLAIIVPITIAAIFFLLFTLFNSVRYATLIITVLPFASIGGIVALFVTGEYLSVPASVGFIALWGIAVLNGVVLVSYIRSLREEGMSQAQAIVQGCTMRFRPVLMTATVAMLGLIPFLFATGPGSEVQRPLAIVVIGGLVSATALTLLLLPLLYRRFGLTPATVANPESTR